MRSATHGADLKPTKRARARRARARACVRHHRPKIKSFVAQKKSTKPGHQRRAVPWRRRGASPWAQRERRPRGCWRCRGPWTMEVLQHAPPWDEAKEDISATLSLVKSKSLDRRAKVKEAQFSREIESRCSLFAPLADVLSAAAECCPGCLLSAGERTKLEHLHRFACKYLGRRAIRHWKGPYLRHRGVHHQFILELEQRIRRWRLEHHLAPCMQAWRAHHCFANLAQVQRRLRKQGGVRRWIRLAEAERRFKACERAAATIHKAQIKRTKALGLRTWHEHAFPLIVLNAKAKLALEKMGVRAYRCGRWFRRWHEHAVADGRRRRILREALSRRTPGERDTVRGFEGFAQRMPSWQNGSRVRISTSGFTAKHERGRCLDGVIGAPAINPGSLYRFAFVVDCTGPERGAGVIVGVTDADSGEGGGDAAASVWGLSLTHGALYTRKGLDKGSLGNQTLSTPLSDLRSFEAYVVDVEVNLRTRRLAFAARLDDGGPGNLAPMLQTDAILPDAPLRPWAFVWNAEDAVHLLPRRRPRRPTMKSARDRGPLSSRLLTPKRLPAPHVPWDGSPHTVASTARSQLRYGGGSSSSRMPSRSSGSPASPSYTSSRGSPPQPVPQCADRRDGAGSPPPEDHPLQPGRRTETSTPPPSRPAGPSLQMTTTSSPSAAPLHTSSGSRHHSPHLAQSSTSYRQRQQQQESPHLYEFSLGVFETRQPHSPREKPRSFSWDVVKYVTGLYKDVYRSL